MAQAADVFVLLVAAVACSLLQNYVGAAAASDQTWSIVLVSGETLHSESQKYSISLEGCNLKVYKHGHHIIWQSGMEDENVNVDCQLSLHSDGSAIIFSGTHDLSASSNTGSSTPRADILVTQHKGISFRQDENGQVLVATWATSNEENSHGTVKVSVEFNLPTQPALYQVPVLSSDIDLLPQLISSPVHSSPQSEILLKASPAHSSTPARDSKKTPRHYRFFSTQSPFLDSSPQLEDSPVDATPCPRESPVRNSPVLLRSSPSNFESPSITSPVNSSPLQRTVNSPLHSTPFIAGKSPQHEERILLHDGKMIDSPALSALQSGLSHAPAFSSTSQLNGSPVKESLVTQDSEAVQVSSFPAHLTKAPVQSTPVTKKGSSAPHVISAGKLKSAPLNSVPGVEKLNSPDQVQFTPRSGPESSTPAQLNSPLQSSPWSTLSNIPDQSTLTLSSNSIPVDSNSSPSWTFDSPLQSTGNTPLVSTTLSLHSSPVNLAPTLKSRNSPGVDSTPILSSPQLSHSPVDSILAFEASPVESTLDCSTELHSSPLDSTPLGSSPPLNNAQTGNSPLVEVRSSPLDTTPVYSVPDLINSPVNSAPVDSTPTSNNGPLNTIQSVEFVPSPLDSTHDHSASQPDGSPLNSAPIHSTPQLNVVPLDMTPTVGLGSSPVDSTSVQSAPQLSMFPVKSTPVHSSPDSNNAPVDFSPTADHRVSPVGSSPVHSGSPAGPSPVDSAPVTSVPVHSTPQSQNSPVESTPAAQFRKSKVDSALVHSESQSHYFPGDSNAPDDLRRSPATSTPSLERVSSPVGETPVLKSLQINNSPLDLTPAFQLRSSPVKTPQLNASPVEPNPMHSSPQSHAPVISGPKTFLRGHRQFGSPTLEFRSA